MFLFILFTCRYWRMFE